MNKVSYIALENQHNGKEIDISSNMIAEKVTNIVAQHEAADLAKTWESHTADLDFSSLFSAPGTAQAGIADFNIGSNSFSYPEMAETFTVDTAAAHYL